jgi:hypothetical protein
VELIILMAAIGVISGSIGGIGGPGGVPVLLLLNLGIALSPPVAAATASSIFVIATITATGLYYYSDGINWLLAASVGVPALIGTRIGAQVTPKLPVHVFETILAGILLLTTIGIVYQQRHSSSSHSEYALEWRTAQILVKITLSSSLIGVIAGLTGIGGPALTVPLLIYFGIAPITAIGAGLASGILISISTALGHVFQGNTPAFYPFITIGVPYIFSQVIGWRFAHNVSKKTVSYTIAGVAVLGSVLLFV